MGQWMFRLLLAATISMIAAVQARACSMMAEYVRPSNFELVQLSDAIVVATAVEGRPDDFMGRTLFEVTERVKGDSPGRVELAGALGSPAPSNLAEIAYSHPEGHMGPCNRMTFRKGGRYLLFLQRDSDGKLRQTGHAFSRINEDYAGEDNVWMRTVRRYVRLQASAAPMEQIPILEGMLRTRRGPAGEALDAVEVADIRDHLSSLSPYKPTPYLLAAYAALERGKAPAHGVRSRNADAEQSEAEELTRTLFGDRSARGKNGPEARLRVLTALVNGDHPQARPLFDRLAAQASEDPATMGLALRFLAKHGDYGRAFHWIETRLMGLLPRLPARSAQQLIGDVAKVQSGEDAEEGKERWRSDPGAAARWPELALSLYWYQVQAFGPDDAIGFGDAIRALPHDDYRARPLLTLALAADYESGIDEWALLELGDEKKREAWEKLPEKARQAGEDPAALPLQILLSAWQKRHEPVLEHAFCQSEARRLLLIRAIGESGGFLYADLIKKIAASALTQKERALLQDAVARWAERNDDMLQSSVHSGLQTDLRRGRSRGTPIECGNMR